MKNASVIAGLLFALLSPGPSVLCASNQPDTGWPAEVKVDDNVLVLIPGGLSLQGGSDHGDDARWRESMTRNPERWRGSTEWPQHWVHLDNYYIARYEVTSRIYTRFMKDGGYTDRSLWSDEGWKVVEENNLTEPLGWSAGTYLSGEANPDHPVVGISYYESEAFLNWMTRRFPGTFRLPTEAEWEKAASWDEKTQTHRTYPWGEKFDARKCNNGTLGPQAVVAVGSYPEGASPYGIMDMAGNAGEFISDLNGYHYYEKGPAGPEPDLSRRDLAWDNPTGPATADEDPLPMNPERTHLLKGACCLCLEGFPWFRPAARTPVDPSMKGGTRITVGIRMVWDPPEGWNKATELHETGKSSSRGPSTQPATRPATQPATRPSTQPSHEGQSKSGAVSPTGVYRGAAAYHPGTGKVVYFGGRPKDGSEFSGETWLLDDNGWQRWEGKGPSPSARFCHAMACDTQTGAVLLFGGFDGEYRNDLWSWNGTGWKRISDGNDKNWPEPRECHALAYDGRLKRMVLFGGMNAEGKPLGDCWFIEGNHAEKALSDIGAGGPSPRFLHTMAYDTAMQKTLLFGGLTMDGKGPQMLGDFWSLGPDGWNEIETDSPPPRFCTALTYDDDSGKCVLFGGWAERTGIAPAPLGDTWIWDGSKWSQTPSEGGMNPAPRRAHSLVYSPEMKSVALVGGFTQSGQDRLYLRESWQLPANGSHWQRVGEEMTLKVTGQAACCGPAVECVTNALSMHNDSCD